MTFDDSFHRALAAARQARAIHDLPLSRGRIGRLWAEAKAPVGGWKSFAFVMKKDFLDRLESKVKAKRNVRYVRTRDSIHSTLPQKRLDELANLVHFELTKGTIRNNK